MLLCDHLFLLFHLLLILYSICSFICTSAAHTRGRYKSQRGSFGMFVFSDWDQFVLKRPPSDKSLEHDVGFGFRSLLPQFWSTAPWFSALRVLALIQSWLPISWKAGRWVRKAAPCDVTKCVPWQDFINVHCRVFVHYLKHGGGGG